MSFFSSLGSALGGLLGVDDTDVNNTSTSVQDALRSGALHKAADYGATGQALQNQSAALQKQNVGLDWSHVDAADAKLASIRQHYQDQFRDGGLAAKAAVQAEQAGRGLNTMGGIAGIRGDTLKSGDAQGQVASTAQNEIAQAGDAANQLDSQKAAVALQKAVFAAQVSHANLTNHLNAQQTGFDLHNSQENLFNNAQSAFNDVSNQAQSTAIDQQEQQGAIGQAIMQGLLSMVSGGVSTGVSAFNSGSASQPTSTGTMPIGTNIVSSPTGQGAGYIAPSVTMGRSAQVNAPTYQPIFNTQPTLPSTASFFNRG